MRNTFAKRVMKFVGSHSIKHIIGVTMLMGVLLPLGLVFVGLTRLTYRFTSEELISSQLTTMYKNSCVMEIIVNILNYATADAFLDDELKRYLDMANTDTNGTDRIFAHQNIRDIVNKKENAELSTIRAHMVVVDINGNVQSNGIKWRLPKPLSYYRWYEGLSDANGMVYYDATLKELWDVEDSGVFVARMLYSGAGRKQGFVAVHVSQSAFWGKLNALELDYRGNSYVVKSNGQLIASDTEVPPEYIETEPFKEALNLSQNTRKIAHEFITGNEYSGFILPIGSTNLFLINEISKSVLLARITKQMWISFAWLCALEFVFASLVFIFSKTISKPISDLTTIIRRDKNGESGLRASAVGFWETQQLADSFNQMVDARNALLEKVRIEATLKEEAHFDALRAQINPHFLFNTLNSIKWMASINADQTTSHMIADLGRVLDHTLTRSERMVELSAELKVMRSYINIQMMRYGSNFTYKDEVPEDLRSHMVPKFILQPLIENSIIHGLVYLNNGYIRVGGYIGDGDIELFVEDNGIGTDETKLQSLLIRNPGGRGVMTGIGISNVHERLRVQFGASYGLSISSKPGNGFFVTLKMPHIPSKSETEGGSDA